MIKLYLRLWGPRANVIVTDEHGTILDAFFRKPQEGIESGGVYRPQPPQAPPPPKSVREVPPGEDLNTAIERHYRALEIERDRQRALTRCHRILSRKERRTRDRLSEIEHGIERHGEGDHNRHIGDLILANTYRITRGATSVEVTDYEEENRLLTIRLDPTLKAAQNAERYYQKAKKAAERASFLTTSAASLTAQLQSITVQQGELATLPLRDLIRLARELEQEKRQSAKAPATVGLEFSSHGFRILVGRNARENDTLLRRATRGNDWWLHTRDHAGGYVFIRNRPGKSVPLEVLLDAGNLALFFSKARTGGRADLYYTQVKYLRRAKDGPVGLVLPTHEKNLSVELDQERLSRLGIGGDL